MDSDEDQPYLIPDPWDTEQARAYHYGAAQASSQPAAPYVREPDAWQEWAANQTTFTGMQADHDFTARDSAQRTIEHDKPPVWDGQKPDTLARPYAKHLNLWLSTTRVPKKNIGLVLFSYSRGDIKALIDEWEEEDLKSETFGEEFLEHVKKVYYEYLEV